METKFIVSNMQCEGCKKNIEKALKKIKDIQKIDIDLSKKEVKVTYNKIAKQEIIRKINEAGYIAKEI